MTGFATKEELAQIRGALNTGLAEVRVEIANVRGEITKVKSELEVKIADVKSSLIRWVVTFFFLTMLIAILGLYFKK